MVKKKKKKERKVISIRNFIKKFNPKILFYSPNRTTMIIFPSRKLKGRIEGLSRDEKTLEGSAVKRVSLPIPGGHIILSNRVQNLIS